MLNDLFINMLILISFISIGSQLIKNVYFEKLSKLSLILIGVLCGTLGSLLIFYGVEVSNKTIIDFRTIALMIAGIFGGPLPLIIAGAIIATFRIIYFGVTDASVLGTLATCINVVVLLMIRKLNHKPLLRWIYSTGLTLLVSSMALIKLLSDKDDFVYIMGIYWLSHFFVSAIVYMYLDYSLTANKLFRKLKKESTKDFLTDLNNVRQFDLQLSNAIKNAKEKEESLSFLMVDIDYFKKVNDTYGHQEGDVVLKRLARILVENSRSFDIVSRNGGEEFSVILLDCPNAQALKIAERIRKYVESNLFTLSNGTQIPITVSVGVASYPENVDDIEKIVEYSDIALYNAKRSGRNKVCSN